MGLATQGVEIVRRFCEKVSDSSTFTLDLLRAIDMTVNSLGALRETCDGDVKLADEFVKTLEACELSRPIDPDRIICEQIKSGATALGKILQLLKAGRQAAIDDDDLQGDHKDSVVTAYDETISAMDSLREIMLELEGTITKHDAKLTCTVGPFSTMEELIASLDA